MSSSTKLYCCALRHFIRNLSPLCGHARCYFGLQNKLTEPAVHSTRDLSSGVSDKVKEKLKSVPHLKEFLASKRAVIDHQNENNAENNNMTSVQSSQTWNHPYVKADDVHGNSRKVFIETYGCQMNVNDTEIVRSILTKNGYLEEKKIEKADVILVMTCSIREGAEKKIWNRLEHLKAMKRKRQERGVGHPLKIGIIGCMAERLKSRLVEKEKMVDVVAGPDSYRDLPRLLASAESGQAAVNVLLSLEETYADIMPVRTNPNSPTAFVSIMRGCDNLCSYCIVPFTRGRERSRPISSILDEIRMLSDQGIKDVTLLGQNVNSYCDRSEDVRGNASSDEFLSRGFQNPSIFRPKVGGRRFAELLHSVSMIDPEMRIRFTSPHPKDFPDQVLQVIKERPNICKCIHLPAQSGNSEVLEQMGRGYTREAYIELVDHIREILPDVALTSDFICGFCGETEEAHQDTLSLLERVRYSFVYVFPYSMREKTRAHYRLTDDVPEDVKKRRVDEVVNCFRKIMLENHRKLIGSYQLVLVEGPSRRSSEDLAGRNDGNTKVIFPQASIPVSQGEASTKNIKTGDYIVVQIDDCSSQVLKGKPVHHTTLQDFHNLYAAGVKLNIPHHASCGVTA